MPTVIQLLLPVNAVFFCVFPGEPLLNIELGQRDGGKEMLAA